MTKISTMGSPTRPVTERERTGSTHERWPSEARWLAGAAGFLLVNQCRHHRNSALWTLLGTVGFGLILRVIANRPLTRVLGFDSLHAPNS